MNRPVDDRLNGSLPRATPEEAAASISADATVLVSGFGSVGYPKTVPVAVGEDWLVPSTSIGLTPAFVESADPSYMLL